MSNVDILSEEFAQLAATAGLRARQSALDEGYPVVFIDAEGRHVQEMPNGQLLEIRLIPGNPRESHIEILRELQPPLR